MTNGAPFDFQPCLVGKSVTARPLVAADADGLYAAASDPLIWAGHPARTRHERPVFDTYFGGLLSTQSTLTIQETLSGRIIGCSRYYVAPDAPDDMSIGYTFLARDHWGGTTNMVMKVLMLGHLFATRDAAWFHIDPSNLRSQIATRRLGAVHDHDASLDLGSGALPWQCYRLTPAAWDKTVAAQTQQR